MRRAHGRFSSCVAAALMAAAMIFLMPCAKGDSVKVRHREGSLRGFVVLKSEKGAILASGEISEVTRGETVKARMIFYFRDGSVDDETTVYSQKSDFRLISDRHVQRGPSFPEPCEVNIDVRSQQVSTRSLSHPNAEVKTEQVEMPSDLANGLLFNLVKDLPKGAPKLKVSYLSMSLKPRMVKLAVALGKEDAFMVAGRRIKALKWDVKPELGGLTGIVAPMIGKQPPDLHVWVAEGAVPVVIRVDASLYDGGPVWSIQMASPAW